jgi:hypothetical protein
LLDRLHGINGFDQNPDLDHIAGFPVVGFSGEAGGDDHAMRVFVKDKSVAHREPPSEMGTMERSNFVGTGFPSP